MASQESFLTSLDEDYALAVRGRATRSRNTSAATTNYQKVYGRHLSIAGFFSLQYQYTNVNQLAEIHIN